MTPAAPMGTITENSVPCQEAALAAAKKALENARERAPVRPSYGEFVFQSRYCLAESVSAMNLDQENLPELVAIICVFSIARRCNMSC